jgi:uncharacterized protein
MARARINDRKDVLLLLLYSPGRAESVNEPIVGRTRLVKMLFLFKAEGLHHFRKGTELTEDTFYQFFPWNFGPFSREVYDDLTFFLLRGFIEAEPANEESLPESAAEWEEWLRTSGGNSPDDELDPYHEEVFRLTDAGVKFTESLYAELSPSQKRFVRQFKARLTNAPLRAILRYVYEAYPDQADRSQIRDDVLRTRLSSAT